MAITTATDWKIYDEQLRNGYAERIAQNMQVMVEKGNGAIVIEDATVPGNYLKQGFFKLPSGLVSRRIATGTGSTSAVTPVTVSQGENVEVRLSRKIGPVDVTLDALRKAGIDEAGFSNFLGEQIADAVMQKMLDDGITAAVAAAGKTATLSDRTAVTVKTLNRAALAAGMKKLGDQQQSIVAWLGHSYSYGQLVDEANTVTAGNDTILSNFALYGAAQYTLGRPFFMTDTSSLILDQTVDKYYTLGLTAGAIRIKADTQLTDVFAERISGLENLTFRIQGERDWFLGIKGYAYDVTSGGANPDNTALGTSTNWDLAATSYKQASGVLIKTQ